MNDIKFGDKYRLRSDQYQYWVEERILSEKMGKETFKRISGYRSKLKDVCTDLLLNRVNEVEYDDFREAVKQLSEIQAELVALIGQLAEQLDEKIKELK